MTKPKRRPDRLKIGKRNQLRKGSTHFNWNHFLTELVSGSYYFAPSLWPWITVQFLPLKPHLILSFSNAFYFQKSQEKKKHEVHEIFSRNRKKLFNSLPYGYCLKPHAKRLFSYIMNPAFSRKNQGKDRK